MQSGSRIVAWLFLAALPATASTARAQIDDHYTCYKMKDTGKYEATVQMLDSTVLGDSATCEVKVAGALYCVPTTEEIDSSDVPTSPFPGPEMINDRICYKVKCDEKLTATPSVQDQYGTRVVEKLKRNMICTPALQPVVDVCPTHYDVTAAPISGTSPVEIGWSGLGHGSDYASTPFAFPVDVSCASATPPCGTCTLTGGAAAGQTGLCGNDRGIACNTFPGGPDPVCGGNFCDFFASPPQPYSLGTHSVCVVNLLNQVPNGSYDVEGGGGALTLQMMSKYHLGISLQRPCPVCIDDEVANDGILGGICDGGDRNGDACDAEGGDSVFGRTSSNCPPSTAANVTGAGLRNVLSLSSGVSTLTAGDPCEAPNDGFDCHCGACSLNPTVACQADSDCSGMGLGTCNYGGGRRRPNGCNDAAFNCEDQGDGTGRCDADGPDDKYCAFFVRADGSGVIPCTSNTDCNALVCSGSSCGPCTLSERRRCFLPTIVAAGDADPTTPVFAAATCLGPTASDAVNAAVGLPGPQRVRFEMQLE